MMAMLLAFATALAQDSAPRPAKPVTLEAKDRALGDVVRDACAQAGVACEVPASIAARPVSVKAERLPLLRVLDGLCGEGVSYAIADGQVRFAAKSAALAPAGYADVFRARLRRAMTFEEEDYAKGSTAMVLYFAFDAEPGASFRDARVDSVKARAGTREHAFRRATDVKSGQSVASGGSGLSLRDGVPVVHTEDLRLETAVLATRLPPDLKTFDWMQVTATLRFAGGMRGGAWKGSFEKRTDLTGTVLRARCSSMSVDLETSDKSSVEGACDPKSLVVVTADGEEYACGMVMGEKTGDATVFLKPQVPEGKAIAEIRLSVYGEVSDRTVTFELTNVKVRR